MALLWFSSKKWSWLLKSVFQVFELNIMNIIEDFKRYFQTGRAKTPISILYQYISSKLVILICLCSTINYFTARGCLIFLNNKSFKNEPESTCTWMLRFFFFLIYIVSSIWIPTLQVSSASAIWNTDLWQWTTVFAWTLTFSQEIVPRQRTRWLWAKLIVFSFLNNHRLAHPFPWHQIAFQGLDL